MSPGGRLAVPDAPRLARFASLGDLIKPHFDLEPAPTHPPRCHRCPKF